MIDLPTIKRYALLTKELAIKEFALKYKRASLGLLWALISPTVVIITLSVAFSKFMFQEDIPHYGLLVVLGMIMWNSFSEATNSSVGSIHGKGDLIGKITFPRSIFVVSSCLATFITLLISLVIFFVILLVYKVELSLHILLCPIYVIELFFLVLGFSFMLIGFTVKRRDAMHFWQLVISVGFWLTPIIYTLEKVPARVRPIFSLNPMARIITEVRAVVFGHELRPLPETLSTAALIAAIFIFGYYQFHRKSALLAEG